MVPVHTTRFSFFLTLDFEPEEGGNSSIIEHGFPNKNASTQ